MATVGVLSPLVIGLALLAMACASAPAPAPAPPRQRAVRGGAARFPKLRRDSPVLPQPASPEARKPDPEGRRFFLDHLTEPPLSPVDGPPPPVTAIGIENTARGETVGLVPLGPIVSARLAAGRRIELPASIEPEGCVTWVAQGGLGADEVDLFLTTGRGEALTVLAEDDLLGPVAILGGKKGCFGAPAGGALDATLSVVLRRGAGPVLVRGYRREAQAPGPPGKK